MSSFYAIPGLTGTIQIGTVSVLLPGAAPTVTNTGTAQAAILNFGIPQGAVGTISAAGVGSAAAPSITFAADTDTGFFSSGVDTFDITTGGTAKWRVDNTSEPLKEILGGVYYPVFSQADVGSAPNQVPLNQNLGALAYVDQVPQLRASASVPANNLDINFEYVSDTSIKIRMRGSDGTVRSTTLTLS